MSYIECFTFNFYLFLLINWLARLFSEFLSSGLVRLLNCYWGLSQLPRHVVLGRCSPLNHTGQTHSFLVKGTEVGLGLKNISSERNHMRSTDMDEGRRNVKEIARMQESEAWRNNTSTA